MALKKSQKSLKKWTKQDWGTRSGKPSTQGPKATGERYLPKAAQKALTSAEAAATTRKKRKDTAEGKQYSKQPKKIAAKTAKKRKQIMPMVGKKKYPYTREGMAAAMEDSKKSGKKMSYQKKKKMEDKKKSKK